MSVRPCENIVKPVVCNPTISFVQHLKEVEDFDPIWRARLRPEKPLTYSYAGIHVLIDAAIWGKIAFIPYLYKKEKKLLNLGDTRGWTALSYAALYNQIETARALLNLGADPNLSSIGDMDVQVVDDMDVQVVDDMDVQVSDSQQELFTFPMGTTCLDIALSRPDGVKMAVLLLKFNAQTNKVDDFGKQNFIYAKTLLDRHRRARCEQIHIATRSMGIEILGKEIQTIAEYV